MSKRTSDLFAAARRGSGPTDAERARMRRAIGRRAAAVAAGAAITGASADTAARVAVSSGSSVAGATTTSLGLLGKIVTPLVLVGALGGGGALAVHASRATAPTAVAAAPSPIVAPRAGAPMASAAPLASVASVAPVAPEELRASTPDESRAIAPQAPAAPKRARTDVAPSSLGAELDLLKAAQDALRRGDALASLAFIDESERRFPRPVLGEERDGVRVVALCTAGRASEAAPLARAFTSSYPSSPLARRIDAACAEKK